MVNNHFSLEERLERRPRFHSQWHNCARYVIVLILITYVFFAGGAQELRAEENTRQGIFHPDFATLKVALDRDAMAPPVIMLGSADRITVSFDEFSDEIRRMRCSLVHCNADWQPSGLTESEYLNGFNEAVIDDGEFSRATLTHYVHYSVSVPSENLDPVLPGNYLLKVYDEMFPDKVLLQARFSVCTQEVRIFASLSPRTDIDYLQSHQQLSFDIETSQSLISNLYNDLKVTVMQNFRPETAVTLTSPSAVKGHTAVYSHVPELIFDGGNEYRRMETISTSWPGMGVERIESGANGYTAYLHTDKPRSNRRYEYDQTQAGRFTIREYNSSHSDTQAEYINTVFTLSSPRLNGTEVYLEGDLTDRMLKENSRMDYDPAAKAYVKELFLKQGAYNYQYVTRKIGENHLSTEITEGNFHETDNIYTIYVYYRRPSERFDRLAGMTMVRRK